MRFLLHRLSKATKARPSEDIGKAATRVVRTNGSGLDTTDIRPPPHGDRLIQWGQQCSTSCGCTVRFQGVVDPETSTYETVGYVAKQIVTHLPNGQGASLLTAKGRPMVRECTCESLHYLASQATSHLQGKTTSQAKNILEFHSTRSSTSFRKTALTTQGLPSSDTRCFDVMEEALTAMVKGYMPPARYEKMSMSMNAAEEHPHVTYLKGVGYHHWKRGQDDHELDFRQFWKDYDTPNVSGPMSTLAILDLSMSLITGENEQSETEVDKTLPQDWQSYVDQLYEEDEQESA